MDDYDNDNDDDDDPFDFDNDDECDSNQVLLILRCNVYFLIFNIRSNFLSVLESAQ